MTAAAAREMFIGNVISTWLMIWHVVIGLNMDFAGAQHRPVSTNATAGILSEVRLEKRSGEYL
jgi:hypothetical protein